MPDDPDMLVQLTTARTEFEGYTISTALESAGIPAKVFAGTQKGWEGTVTDPIIVMVRRRDLERAAASLRAVREESVDIDWSDVDVGDQVDPPDAFPICPACGHERGDLSAGAPCPECGYRGVAQNRSTPGSRQTRFFIRRSGFILLTAAMITSWYTPQIAIPALIVAIVMIFWNVGDEPQPSRAQRRQP